MKTLTVDSSGRLEVKEIPRPRYTSKQALVKMISCGICGTDATLIEGGFKGFPQEKYPLMLGARPLIIGKLIFNKCLPRLRKVKPTSKF